MPFEHRTKALIVGCVVCSGVEYAGCVMNLDQYRVLSKTEPDPLDQNEPQSGEAHSRPTSAGFEIMEMCFTFSLKMYFT